jgi:hypothetical protein
MKSDRGLGFEKMGLFVYDTKLNQLSFFVNVVFIRHRLVENPFSGIKSDQAISSLSNPSARVKGQTKSDRFRVWKNGVVCVWIQS